MSKDDFWVSLREHATQAHKERISKNDERIKYAIRQFEINNIEYVLKNSSIGHFHCRRKSDGVLFQFWSGTGKILGYENKRGINSLIQMLKSTVISKNL